MTFGKGLALVIAFVGAIALGVWMGPHIVQRDTTATNVAAPGMSAPDATPQVVARDRQRAPASRRAAAKLVTTSATITRSPVGATARTVPAAAPALHEVLKPLLNKGADMGVASADFVDAEQFAAVAHAARNTEVPFMVLKHRVVEEGKPLEEAIREFKPELNAAAEADRARREGKSDVEALLGN